MFFGWKLQVSKHHYNNMGCKYFAPQKKLYPKGESSCFWATTSSSCPATTAY